LFVTLLACVTHACTTASAEYSATPDLVVLRGGAGAEDPLAPAFDMLASRSVQVLAQQQNARTHTMSAKHFPANALAVRTFAALLDELPSSSGPLILQLIGHGELRAKGPVFNIAEKIELSPAHFNRVLNAWQQQTYRRVTLILDFCHAGAFAQAIDTHQRDRSVLFSCKSDEKACFAVAGFFSYTEFLLESISEGHNLNAAHHYDAKLLTNWQTPGIIGRAVSPFAAETRMSDADPSPASPRQGRAVSPFAAETRMSARTITHNLGDVALARVMPTIPPSGQTNTYNIALVQGHSPAQARHKALLVTRLLNHPHK
jgi:hypothetical protein